MSHVYLIAMLNSDFSINIRNNVLLLKQLYGFVFECDSVDWTELMNDLNIER